MITGFFPGLGSRDAYRNLGRHLLDDSAAAEVYSEAAIALNHAGAPEKVILTSENLPTGRMERLGFIGAAFLAHNVALGAGAPAPFSLYAGESLGMVAAAMAAGSLSVRDGVRIGEVFTPLMMVAADGCDSSDPVARRMALLLDGFTDGRPLVPEPHHVVGVSGPPDQLTTFAQSLAREFPPPDVMEIHKLYSPTQVNVYVGASAYASFALAMRRFPRLNVQELKPPTTFLAHSSRMSGVRRALEKYFATAGIVFADPHTPVVSNNGGGLLTTAGEIQAAVLAVTDEVMDSRITVQTIHALRQALVVEVGLGGKSLRLLRDNEIRCRVLGYTGTVYDRALLRHHATLTTPGPADLPQESDLIAHHARRRNLPESSVLRYITRSERVVGFGSGGSESMAVFLRKEGSPGTTVRKVLSERLVTARWDPRGGGVMLPPFAKAKKQAEYLSGLPWHVRPYFPEVLDLTERQVFARGRAQREVIYDMAFVPGVEVSRFIKRHSPPPAVVARLYQEIFRVLAQKVHVVNRAPAPGGTLETSYFRKIEDRLALCRETAPKTFGPDLLDSEHIIINGVRYLNVKPLLAAFRERPGYRRVLEPRTHSLVMGDTNTENIKLTRPAPLVRAQNLVRSGVAGALDQITAEALGMTFLDPRAIGFESTGRDTRDDPMYDNKPWHNSVGHYDEIHDEYFSLKVWRSGGSPAADVVFTPGNPYQKAYRVRDVAVNPDDVVTPEQPRGIEDYFAAVMTSSSGTASPYYADDPYWLPRFVFTMGTHFAAMPPFHFSSDTQGVLTDTWQVQRRPIAIYCEGVKWLNWALEILEGRRTAFLGVQVPPLP
jgi:hypothetical protein